MKKTYFSMTLGIILLFSILWMLPIILCLTNSFKDYNSIISNFFAPPKKIDFSIYAETWNVLELGGKFTTTVLYTVSTTVAVGILAPMAAYKLGRSKGKISSALIVLFTLPIMVPFTTYCVPLSSLMGKINLTNTRIGYILVSIGVSIPFCVHVIRSFVDTVPYEIEECAMIDGAQPFTLFIRIVYPLLLPAISTALIVTAISTWNDLIICKIIAGASDTLANIQMKLFSRFSSSSSDWNHAFPAIVMSFIPTIAFFLFMQEKVVSGVTAGAVKG